MASEKTKKRLALICLVCAVLAWLSLPVMGAGSVLFILGIISIFSGIRVLRLMRIRPDLKYKRMALAGLFLGLSSILFVFAAFIWIAICFMINPVAH